MGYAHGQGRCERVKVMAYVTDHAVLRYLQRHCGIDVEAIRAELTVRGIDVAANFGCGTVKLGNGARLRLQGDVASTCIESRKDKRRRKRERRSAGHE